MHDRNERDRTNWLRTLQRPDWPEVLTGIGAGLLFAALFNLF